MTEMNFDLPTPAQIRAWLLENLTGDPRLPSEEPSPFKIGDEVEKRSEYPFDSTVVACFRTLAGEWRVVCESHAIPGLLHIFSPSQLILCK